MNSITNQRSFQIHSFYYKKDNSNIIDYYFDCEQEYISAVNRITVTKIYIPNAIWQFDPSDYFILEEGGIQVRVNLNYANYKTNENMVNDLETYLNLNSPNGYTYNITIIPNQDRMNITVNDNTKTKRILIPEDKHLPIAYGLKSINIFQNNNILQSDILQKEPITQILVTTGIITSYDNSNPFLSSVITTFDLKQDREQGPPDLLTGARLYNQSKSARFVLTDFDGEILELDGNKDWYMEVVLFTYDEELTKQMKQYIDIMLYSLIENKQKKIEEKNKQINEIYMDDVDL